MDNRERGLLQQRIALGYADENIEREDDTDPLASKLGGRPLWLDTTSAIPEQNITICEECGLSMVLLAQIYAPLSESPYERVLYIWSCVRRTCTGRPGATRVIRAHLLNPEYALRVVKQKKSEFNKECKQAKSIQHIQNSSAISKPAEGAFDFGSVWRSNAGTHVSTVGDKLFSSPLFSADATVAKASTGTADGKNRTADDLDAVSADLGQLRIDLESPAERTDWNQDLNCVQARYLAFDEEEMDGSPDDAVIGERYRVEIDQALNKIQCASEYNHETQGRSCSKKTRKDEEDDGWTGEKYERTKFPKGADAAFARFAAVVGRNPEQVMRYQFNGIPLLYTLHDEISILLEHSANHGYDDDDDDDDDNNISSGKFSMNNLPRCPRCNGRRIFECQLMPALLTALPLSVKVPLHLADKEGIQVASTADKNPLVGSRLMQSLDLGLEFGTILIFVCENDCHDGKMGTRYLGQSAESMLSYAGAAYYDELALVQLESHLH
ncbi:hypothetical protein COEREDRAFT_79740 [Coemansia reversa NRRL 1564]|uniref:Programmed cell death protein 2 C-terminal domain-containing protein n=1 Tax=Coemansia reversa (strain ATCC 12441 / NRRL 1564) TaxID=763665 RepID=A0A2G5BIA5_COERN|nr:hypothetical protein COEREDRAFT_79740 [Coemansia reversa NRRL 1564]|eukprot:PIA18754.1 hypothetical protein COEREDRAFT_79740 [Coemansia reversa NRRL 1564]